MTTLQMDAGLDTGPVLRRHSIPMPPRATAGSLHDTLAVLGAKAIVEAVASLEAGALHPTPQPAQGASYAPRIAKEDGRIAWHRPALEIERHIRAMTPWPGAQTGLGGRPLKILEAELGPPSAEAPADPGLLVAMEGRAALVQTGSGLLRVRRLQPAGKGPMSPASYLDGRRLKPPLLLDPE